MAIADNRTSTATAVAVPWYDLLPDPEPPEDGMQQEAPIRHIMTMLEARYADDPSVLCSGMLVNVIYDSRVPGSFVSPDGFIVFGLETDSRAIRLNRRSYRIDEWGRTPAFVLEVASESTARRDMGVKRDIYARMGVQEYWRLDLFGEYYREPLVGETLVDGEYQRFELHTESNGDVWSRSEVLGVDFVHRVEEGYPRFLLRDSLTGEWLHTLTEERAARLAAEAGWQSEAAARQMAEAGWQGAEAARQAEAAARQAEAERADRLQAELDELRRQREGSS